MRRKDEVGAFRILPKLAQTRPSDDSLTWKVYRVRSNNLCIRANIESTGNNSKLSSKFVGIKRCA